MAEESVCRQEVTVNLELGLHLRPISQIAELVRESDCEVWIRNGDTAVNAANVLDLMILKAGHGTRLLLEANGRDAAKAIEALVKMFESNFDAGEASGP